MKNTATLDACSGQRAYTIAQAAQILGVHKVNVYRRIYEGKLKTLSGFPRLMISAIELDRFLDRSEVYVPRKRKRKIESVNGCGTEPAEVANGRLRELEEIRG
jgi:Helix-turn-helix domain